VILALVGGPARPGTLTGLARLATELGALTTPQLLVNATLLGLTGGAEEDRLPVPSAAVECGHGARRRGLPPDMPSPSALLMTGLYTMTARGTGRRPQPTRPRRQHRHVRTQL
jgi:hypothetical protein